MCMWAIVVHVAVLTISEPRAVGKKGFRNIAMEPWSGNSLVTADLLSDLTVLIRGFFQRQITEQNLTQACLTGTIPNFIIFDRMKDKLVVNTMTEFDRYWSGNSRVTAD